MNENTKQARRTVYSLMSADLQKWDPEMSIQLYQMYVLPVLYISTVGLYSERNIPFEKGTFLPVLKGSLFLRKEDYFRISSGTLATIYIKMI